MRFLGEADIDTEFLDRSGVSLGGSVASGKDAVEFLEDPKIKPIPPATLQVSEPTFTPDLEGISAWAEIPAPSVIKAAVAAASTMKCLVIDIS